MVVGVRGAGLYNSLRMEKRSECKHDIATALKFVHHGDGVRWWEREQSVVTLEPPCVCVCAFEARLASRPITLEWQSMSHSVRGSCRNVTVNNGQTTQCPGCANSATCKRSEDGGRQAGGAVETVKSERPC